MELPAKLTKFFKKNKVHYEIQVHPETFTASATAEVEHVPGRMFAKVVMAKAEGDDVMVVLPSTRNVDLLKLSSALGKLDVRIEDEVEFRDLFPDCEIGAMPPFGKIYDVPCCADERLEGEEYLYFNAGNHWETVKISAADFFRVSKAIKGDFSVACSN